MLNFITFINWQVKVKKTIIALANTLGIISPLISLRDRKIRAFYSRVWNDIVQNKDLDKPVNIVYEVTKLCNQNCQFCFQEKYRKDALCGKSKELNFKEIKNIFRDIKPYAQKIGITGGEPFTRPDFMDILTYLNTFDIPLNIVSNGTLITPEKIEQLKKISNLTNIAISIHGLEKTHNQVVKSPNAFQKATNSIKLLSKANIWISINCVISKSNLSELPEIVVLGKQLGCNSIGFQLEMFCTQQEKNDSLSVLKIADKKDLILMPIMKEYSFSLKEIKSAWNKVITQSKKLSMPVTFTSPLLYKGFDDFYKGTVREKPLGCYSMLNAYISPEGKVFSCEFIRKSFGDLRKSKFKDIWNSKPIKSLRKVITANNLLPMCSRCCKQNFRNCGKGLH